MAMLRAELPVVAAATAAAVLDEVPGYSALGGALGTTLDEAVEMALRGFLNVTSGARGSDPGSPLQPALDAAYDLGRGEASNGRTMDALLAAYRVGARVAWRELARVAVAADVPAKALAQFAELTFAYIDELSAASVSGHAEQLATGDRVLQRDLERLTRRLLAGDPADVLQASADQAEWQPPETLGALLLPGTHMRGLRPLIDARTLLLSDDLPGVETHVETVLLLVPIVDASARARLKQTLSGRYAVLGPARPWMQVRVSYDRALQVRRLGLGASSADTVDADDYLTDLVIGSDPDALADLRAQVLAPLDGVRDSTADKLAATLRAWLLHQGRRDDVAASLFVHPQTVRYRMGQLRELYGDRLDDPATILAASIALGTIKREPTGP